MMSAGNGSSVAPKPVPAWLNSAAWASKPRSPVRSSYSFGERSSSAHFESRGGKPAGDNEDFVSKISKVHGENSMQHGESEVQGGLVAPTTQACFLIGRISGFGFSLHLAVHLIFVVWSFTQLNPKNIQIRDGSSMSLCLFHTTKFPGFHESCTKDWCQILFSGLMAWSNCDNCSRCCRG